MFQERVKHYKHIYKSVIASFPVLSIYFLLSKGLSFIVLIPLYKYFVQRLLNPTAQTVIANTNILSALFTAQGLALLLLSLIFILIFIITDINFYIHLSKYYLNINSLEKLKFHDHLQLGDIKEQVQRSDVKDHIQRSNTQELLKLFFKQSLNSAKTLFLPSGLLVVLYLAIIVPFSGLGLSITIFKGLKIPNFITDVIFNNINYSLIYFGIQVLLIILSALLLFSFHYICLSSYKPSKALHSSAKLFKKCFKTFFSELLLTLLLFSLAIFIIASFLVIIIYSSSSLASLSQILSRYFLVFFSLISLSIFVGISLLSLPISIFIISDFFLRNEDSNYQFRKLSSKETSKIGQKTMGEVLNYKISPKPNEVLSGIGPKPSSILSSENLNKARSKHRKLTKPSLLLILGFYLIVSAFLTYNFDDIFRPVIKAEIVAHRGGGKLATENTLFALQTASSKGIQWAEIDVQRSKDSVYFLFHDRTLQRLVAPESITTQNADLLDLACTELSWKELQSFKISDTNCINPQAQPLASLEDVLKNSPSNFSFFLELKGESADTKMVDDLVLMLDEYKLQSRVVLVSLDYNLIEYIEKEYPKINSGFIYFAKINKTASIKADYLLIEEGSLKDSFAELIFHKKKLATWTINDTESLNKIATYELDFIISDHLDDIETALAKIKNTSELELLLNWLKNLLV